MALVKESQNLDGFNVGKDDFAPKPIVENKPATTQVPVGGVAPAKDLPVGPPASTTQLPVYNTPDMPLSADDVFYVDDNMLDSGDNFSTLEDMLSGSGSIAIEVDDEEPDVESFEFTLPLVPGGEEQSPIEDEPELKVEEPEVDDVDMPKDIWAWKIPVFMTWLQERMLGIPRHSGKEISGIERAIAYLKRLDSEISKAVRSDIDDALDIAKIESVRDEIFDGIERLEDRLEKLMKSKRTKKNKKSSEEFNAIVKEASKSAAFVVTVPLFISSLARTCLNAMISNGKDIEETFDKLAKKFDLTHREEAELMQLLSDMGYAMRRDRGLFREDKFDATSCENPELMANYPA